MGQSKAVITVQISVLLVDADTLHPPPLRPALLIVQDLNIVPVNGVSGIMTVLGNGRGLWAIEAEGIPVFLDTLFEAAACFTHVIPPRSSRGSRCI